MATRTRGPGEAAATSPRGGPRVPRIDVVTSVRRHPLAAALPVIVFLMVALTLGLTRTPVHTAEARLSVGGVDFSAPGALSGFATASQALASTYARAVEAPEVQEAAFAAVGDPRSGDFVTATPLPESPVVRVLAESAQADRSIALANAASEALAEFAEQLNRGGDDRDLTRLYEQYEAAARQAQTALLERDEAAAAADQGGGSARQALIDARAGYTAAALREEAARANYLAAARGQVAVARVEQLTVAQSATNDRFKRLQLFLFVGLISGGLLGMALATLQANRTAFRSFTRQSV